MNFLGLSAHYAVMLPMFSLLLCLCFETVELSRGSGGIKLPKQTVEVNAHNCASRQKEAGNANGAVRDSISREFFDRTEKSTVCEQRRWGYSAHETSVLLRDPPALSATRLRGGHTRSESPKRSERGSRAQKPQGSGPGEHKLSEAILADIARRAGRSREKRAAREQDDFSDPEERTVGSTSAAGGELAGSWSVLGPAQKKTRVEKEGSSKEGGAVSAEEYRSEHQIAITGGEEGVPLRDPVQSFARAPFCPEILNELKRASFTLPSPIQAQVWPYLVAKSDVIAVAKTGSGKTVGYLLPGFMRILSQNKDLELRRRGARPSLFGGRPAPSPTVLVLAPTRELIVQIAEESRKFGSSCSIRTVAVFGGVSKGMQLREIRGGVHLLAATPGRLNDLLEMKALDLSQVRYLVLDEADRMLDMGFEPQIRTIIKACPQPAAATQPSGDEGGGDEGGGGGGGGKGGGGGGSGGRQTVMFTATWPKSVQRLASSFLRQAVQVNVGRSDLLVVNSDIQQTLHQTSTSDKEATLLRVLRGISSRPGELAQKAVSAIVFVNKKSACDAIARTLKKEGWSAASMHGGKTQDERLRILNAFTAGRAQIIVATDVASRGLDIKGVSHVINYDLPPGGVEDWVHRVGRTGRAGAKGIAHSFVAAHDAPNARNLIKVMEEAKQEVPSFLRELAAKAGVRKGGGGRRYGGGGRFGGRGGSDWRSAYGGGRGGRGGGAGGRGGGRGGRGGQFGGGGGFRRGTEWQGSRINFREGAQNR